jgi:hypothetical protein
MPRARHNIRICREFHVTARLVPTADKASERTLPPGSILGVANRLPFGEIVTTALGKLMRGLTVANRGRSKVFSGVSSPGEFDLRPCGGSIRKNRMAR